MVRALDMMAQHGWIDDQSAIETALRFAGEFVNVEQVMDRIRTKGPAQPIAAKQGAGRPEGSAPGTGGGVEE